jgi:hypothetical protein
VNGYQEETTGAEHADLFARLIQRANAGDAEAVQRLRRFLDLHPKIWRRAGDLAVIAEMAWTNLVVGGNLLMAESVKRRVEEMKGELAGPRPTALEKLLIDQVVVNWLAAQQAQIEAASMTGGSSAQAAFRLKRAESAQRRYLGAVKTLTTLRALVPQGLAPLDPVSVFKLRRKPA